MQIQIHENTEYLSIDEKGFNYYMNKGMNFCLK